MIVEIVGRKKELSLLENIVNSKEASFLAIYGRRRVGKTFLITRFFENTNNVFFRVTGLKDGSYREQLRIFNKSLTNTFYPGMLLKTPKNWMGAFEQLTQTINKLPKNKRVVLFFDELPWMSTKRAGLVQAIDHYWNTEWSNRAKLTFIACGSAASWMLENLINAEGGLHNRITETISLKPFTLKETKTYLIKKGFSRDDHSILQIYLAIGGIPHYLRQISPKLSAVQNINQLCFIPNDKLFVEFDKLFKSLFENAEMHEDLIRKIAKQNSGLAREELVEKNNKFKSGGYLTKLLGNLEAAGFITSFIPYGKESRDIYYKVIDEYTLFYLRWIEPAKKKLLHIGDDGKYWENMFNTAGYLSWLGYAFELVCYKQIGEILKALKLESLAIGVQSWRYISNGGNKEKGAQIDLIIDRSDNTINVCEIKSSIKPFVISKQYASELRYKMELFKKITKTKKNLLLTFITPNGIVWNNYADELVMAEVKADELL